HLWTRSFGGPKWDNGADVLETSNGDLVIVGTTTSFQSQDRDIWLVRTDSSGIEKWNRSYDIGDDDFGSAITETASGDFVICGGEQDETSTDMLIMSVSSSGIESWNESFGDDTEQVGRDVIQVSDGNLIVIGDSEPFNGMEAVTIWKVDTSGKEVWNMTYSASIQRQWAHGYKIAEITGGDLILFGLKETMPGSGLEFLLMRAASSGKAMWTYTYMATGNTNPYSMTVNQTGVTMVGSTTSSSTAGEEVYIVRTDLSGNKKWDAYYGGPQIDIGAEVLQSPYGLYLFGHSTSWGPGPQGVFLLNLTHDGGGSRGLFVSRNVLGGADVSGLKEITYSADIPSSASIKMRFSKDMVNWFDSNGMKGKYTTISSGNGRVSLTNLQAIGSQFHYEVSFHCDKGDSATMDMLTLKYLTMAPDGQFISTPFDGGEGVRWGRIGYDRDGPEATFVTVRTRTGDTVEELSSKPFTGPDGTEMTSYADNRPIVPSEGGGKLLQIYANLSTADPSSTPVLLNINFTYDRPAEITDPGVTYDTGDIDDDLYFSIIFRDPDDDLPDMVKVEIDGTNHTMLSSDEDMITSDGKEYFHSTKLDAGTHGYRFFMEYWDVVLSTEMETLEVKAGPLMSMVIDPVQVTVTADGFAQFTADGSDRMGNPVEVAPTWEVEGGGTIDLSGNFTADVAGTWIVKATSGTIFAFANVTVNPGALTRIEVTTGTYTVTTDDTVQLAAEGFDADGNTIDIEPAWEAEGGGAVDQNGLFDPTTPGFWRIYANLSGISGSEVIEVQLGALHHIVIEPVEASLNITQTRQFTASGYDADGNQVFLDPHWEVSGGGSIHTSGIFTAETPGTWTVTCTSGEISATATVVVNQLPADDDDDDVGPDDDDTSGGEGVSPILIAVLAAAAVFLIIGAVLLFLLIGKKKKGEEPKEVPGPVPETVPEETYGGYPPVDGGQVPQDDPTGTAPQYDQEVYGYPEGGTDYGPMTQEMPEQAQETQYPTEFPEETPEKTSEEGELTKDAGEG
ncbi:MAG: hypothetical protein ACMUHM_08715, partial [Thermoplasmatota archaeon]